MLSEYDLKYIAYIKAVISYSSVVLPDTIVIKLQPYPDKYYIYTCKRHPHHHPCGVVDRGLSKAVILPYTGQRQFQNMTLNNIKRTST